MNDLFLQTVYDQKEELKKYSFEENWIYRKEESCLNLNSKLAQIVIGVRRSGKSTLIHRALKNQNYGYLNFDDERLIHTSSGQLDDLLRCVFQVYGDIKYLFLDEIQNVENWQLFVNRLLRSDMLLFITGSNSKLLSGELATHITGRYSIVELFPFSFEEYVQLLKLDKNNLSTKNKALLNKAFEEYTLQGGFPEIIKGEEAPNYITNLFHSIITRDIFYRYVIQYTKSFKDVALYLVNNFGREISYNRIKNIFGIGSENTVKNYVSYLEEAYLALTLQKFSFKKQESLRYRKNYLVDTVFASVLASNFTADSGYLLENIVFLELLRNRPFNPTEIYYYKKQYEVDFVVVKNGKVEELIQVCEELDNPKTLNREIRALIASSSELYCNKLTLISKNKKDIIKAEGKEIRIVPVIEWLLC
jgi:predicted AAA+ superfamily ATPase